MFRRRIIALLAAAAILMTMIVPVFASAGEEEIEWLSRDEAVAYILEQYTLWTPSFTVHIEADREEVNADPFGYWDFITDMAEIHTGHPKQGDYMHHFSPNTYAVSEPYGDVDRVTYYITPVSYTTQEQEAEMDIAVAAVLGELDLWEASDYDKLRGVYDYICENVTYDYEGRDDDSDNLEHTAYKALVHGTAVCDGYAILLYRLLLELGVDCRMIRGMAGESHAWNIVELDGLYYCVDATWDAGRDSYDYFLLTEEEMSADHTPYDQFLTEEWRADYPMAEEHYRTSCSGIYADGITWELDGDTGILTVSGTGAMPDDASDTFHYWHHFKEEVTGIMVGEGITSVGDWAFAGCSNAEWVQLPDTLERIGEDAFSGCKSLREVELPEGLSVIETGAFAHCEGLSTLELPNGLTAVGEAAFAGCSSLTEFSIPDSVTELGYRVFSNCSSLTSVKLPEGIESIGPWMLANCDSLTSFEVPDTVSTIWQWAFSACDSLRELTVRGNVDGIWEYAFGDCPELKFIRFCGQVGMIHDAAIGANTPLTAVYFDLEETAAQITGPDSLGGLCANAQSIAVPASAEGLSNYITENFTVVSEVFYDGMEYALYADHECHWSADTAEDVIHTCTVCGAKRQVSAAEHDYQVAVTAPTCTGRGYTTHTCTLCGDTYDSDFTEVIPHLYSDWAVTLAPTCIQGGVEERSCTVCGHSENQYLSALGHSMGDWYVTVESGCMALAQHGEERRDCTGCDLYETRVLYASQHIYTAQVVAPTCEEDGYTLCTCVCGDSYRDNVVEAPGHDVVTEQLTEPTCTEYGTQRYYCTVCGYEFTASWPRPTGHTEVVDPAVPPTCTEDGLTEGSHCEVCGVVLRHQYLVQAAGGHTYGDWYVSVEGTCVAPGEECRDCTLCDAYETREIYDGDHQYTAEVVHPACTDWGCTQYTCTLCGDICQEDWTEPLGHDYVVLPAVPPTCTEPGLTEGEQCARCGRLSSRQWPVPATGHSYADGVCTACGEADPDYAAPIFYGDANGDGKISTVDLAMLRRYLANIDPDTGLSSITVQVGADANGDGKVNTVDLAMLRRYLANIDPISGESSVVLGPKK